jgi:hypothetical protein
MSENNHYILRRTLEAFPAVVVLGGFIVAYIDVSPIFDAKLYYDCLRFAAHHSFSLDNFLCFQHPTLLFVGLFAIPEYFFPGSLPVMHLTMLLLGCISFIALSSILFLLFPAPDKRIFRIVGLLILATQPVLIANAVGFILDLGVLFFGIIFLALLLHERYIAASIAGLMLVFTKEPGTFLYLSSLLLFFLIVRPPNIADIFRTPRKFLRQHGVLLLPIILFVIYVGIRTVQQKTSILLLSRSFIDSSWRILMFWSEIFLFQFRWFASALTVIGLVCWIRKVRRKAPLSRDADILFRRTTFLVALLLINSFLLTQGIPWNNLRYFLVPLTLCMLVFIIMLPQIFSGMRPIIACLVMMLALNGIELFHSTDPFSRWLLGTFPFGEHRLYAMGMVDEDGRPSTGRDQLVYNLEFMKLLELQEEIFRWIRPVDGTIIVGQDGAYHYSISDQNYPAFPAMIDPVSFRFTEATGSIRPVFTMLNSDFLQSGLPSILYFIEFANLDKEGLILLREKYDVLEEKTFDLQGYHMRAFKMKLKAGDA